MTTEDGGFPWGRVDVVAFEDDTVPRRSLGPGQYVAVEEDELVLHSTATGDREVLDVSTIEAVRLVPRDGVAEWLDVLTVDDLERFDRMPAVARIELRDGSTIVPDPDRGQTVAWSPERLALVVRRGVDDDDARTIVLDEIEVIELLEDTSFLQTLRSPMLWVATAATAGAVILIGRGRGDRDTNATS